MARGWRDAIVLLAAGCLLVSCATTGTGTFSGTAPAVEATDGEDPRDTAYRRLLGRLNTFRVSGAVKTDDDLLLPETIRVTIKSEVCVESRTPGSRFWSLDYDTCFVYVAVDSLDDRGEYTASVPCLDADRSYESRHAFGDLRLVQRGPVSFLAESDAGWRHQETFTSSRTQRRDLVLSLDTDTFWVVTREAAFHCRPDTTTDLLKTYPFGTGMEVMRFHGGWAECRMGSFLGWVQMRHLGTEDEMRRNQAVMGSRTPRPRAIPLPSGEDEQ
ncbi:hypothetical protein K8I85_08570 [bacterium]|nr:hypothetical protein [bacterium]